MKKRSTPHQRSNARMTKEQTQGPSEISLRLLTLMREKRNTVLAEINAEEDQAVRQAAKQDGIDVDAGWKWDRDNLVWKLPARPAAK